MCNSKSLRHKNFEGNLDKYQETINNIKTGLKKEGFISGKNEEDIKNSADKIVRQLECFKLKSKDEFDVKYK